MKVLIELPDMKDTDDYFMLGRVRLPNDRSKFGEAIVAAVKNGVPIIDNATNGDMIKALFPNYESRYDPEYEIITGHLDKTHRHNFNLDWWNAPYKGA